MTNKQRLAQAERIARKAKDTRQMTWKQFIESDGKAWDAETKAAWAEFIADKDKPKP